MKLVKISEIGFGQLLEITPSKHGDNRGFFSETYNRRTWDGLGIDVEFVQDNHSFSAQKGTLRGLHFQVPPVSQGKLVRVIEGEIFDVAVDIRQGSPTFAQWVGVFISATKWNQVYIPPGFAHGFLTMTENTQVLYKVTDYYSSEHDRAIRFDDPQVGIEWPHVGCEFEMSKKDRDAPLVSEIDTQFYQFAEKQ